ncbi:peptidase T1A, proteasome beta-subunit [Artemisia annua]|uniref:Peptidase T1A, proteasome beta-subunit n=1 Tax=Artemisia annua TaxID=35608 RepID=A0A2U1QA44_ARTAN|nr:peptidase T1A, proteasome beta-subunit [Artemisia annua]
MILLSLMGLVTRKELKKDVNRFLLQKHNLQLIQRVLQTTLAGDRYAANTEGITASQIYHTGRESTVVTALTLLKSILFRYQGHASATLVLG